MCPETTLAGLASSTSYTSTLLATSDLAATLLLALDALLVAFDISLLLAWTERQVS